MEKGISFRYHFFGLDKRVHYTHLPHSRKERRFHPQVSADAGFSAAVKDKGM
jgi:hypothetical protein